MYQYKDKYIIDFTNVKTYLEMHFVIREALEFPHHYGCNWSAFWDCLTEMYAEPVHIEIIGLEVIREKFDDSADKIVEILKRYKHFCNDLFSDNIKIEIVEGSTRTVIN